LTLDWRAVRRATRLFAAVTIAGATLAALGTIATLADAQPRGRGRSGAKPKVDAQAAAPPEQADSGAAASSAPGAGPVPDPGGGEVGDASVKPSPLNPTAQEMPGQTDAGAPLDYDRLLADIAALRARVAAVSDNLYQSRIAVALETDGDHGRIARLTVSLDDGIVYTAPASFTASDMTTVYDHAVAPGRHAVTVDVDRKDDRDESFRTSQRSRFTVDVPRDQRLSVEVRIDDDSSMGGDFPSDKSGKYDLRFRVKAVAKAAGK
jgi:hypothetical protein